MGKKNKRAAALLQAPAQAKTRHPIKSDDPRTSSLPQSSDYINNPLYNLIPLGRENARTAKELTEAMGYNHWRDVTKEINHLRNAGAVICAAGEKPAGYFRPRDPDEARHFVSSMHSRIREIRSAVKSAENYINEMGGVNAV